MGLIAYNRINVIEGIEILLFLVRVRRRTRIESLRGSDKDKIFEISGKKKAIARKGTRITRILLGLYYGIWNFDVPAISGERFEEIKRLDTCAVCFVDLLVTSPSAC